MQDTPELPRAKARALGRQARARNGDYSHLNLGGGSSSSSSSAAARPDPATETCLGLLPASAAARLPDDLLCRVLAFACADDLLSASATCREPGAIATDIFGATRVFRRNCNCSRLGTETATPVYTDRSFVLESSL